MNVYFGSRYRQSTIIFRQTNSTGYQSPMYLILFTLIFIIFTAAYGLGDLIRQQGMINTVINSILKKVFTSILGLVLSFIGFSQSCLPDGIIFTTQSQIDSFQVNYPNCTQIEGDVKINGNDISNLNGLNIISNIDGNLTIGSDETGTINLLLNTLNGLNSLNSIGGTLKIKSNHNLSNLNGLEGLVFVGGAIIIENNDDLITLAGLESLTTVLGDLFIEENDVIPYLTGLNNVDTIYGNLKINDNSNLINLTGLDNLAYIWGHLQINSNDMMISMMGLNNLTGVEDFVDLCCHYNLTSFVGLDNMMYIGGRLRICCNFALVNLIGLDNLTTVGGNLEISLSNPLESLIGLQGLTSIGGNLLIWDNDALTDISSLDNVTSIDGELYIVYNSDLTNLIGLENIDAGSITDLNIYENLSLSFCEAQSICDYLSSPNGIVNIYNNASGCNNPPEIANACQITLPCLPYGNYFFSTQNEIDSFQINYPNCTNLEGNVKIHGGNINNLNGLTSIAKIGGNLTIGDWMFQGNPVLTSITGLEGLDSIGGYIGIIQNSTLSDLTGLINLTKVGEGILISFNNVLPSLTGLDNIDAGSITYLYITDNDSLSTCEVHSVCEYLSAPNGTIEIYDNATGCNSQEEVDSACVYLSSGVVILKPVFAIFPNPASNTITISTPTNPNKNTILTIYNINGQVLSRRQITEQNTVVDLSGLSAGVYFVRVVDEKGVSVGKVVKR